LTITGVLGGSLYRIGDTFEGEPITLIERVTDADGNTQHVEVNTATKKIFILDPVEVYVDV